MSGRPKRRRDLGAVDRIQKAKRAKNVKRYARHKQRRSLVEKLEESKESDVIVAPELGIPGVEEEQREEELLRQGPAKKNKKGKRLKVHDDTAEAEEATENPSSATDQKAGSGEGSKVNAPTQQDDEDGAGLRTAVKRKKRFPFQKEMKLREAARLEREKEQQRIKEETEAYHRRREESRKARKEEGKQFRKVTRRGQPVLKHRIDALLQEIQKK